MASNQHWSFLWPVTFKMNVYMEIDQEFLSIHYKQKFNIMEDADYSAAKPLKDAIAKITGYQAKKALEGARVNIVVTDADFTQSLIESSQLKEVLGDNAYNTICTTAFTALGTALTNAKNTAQTAFDNLGD